MLALGGDLLGRGDCAANFLIEIEREIAVGTRRVILDDFALGFALAGQSGKEPLGEAAHALAQHRLPFGFIGAGEALLQRPVVVLEEAPLEGMGVGVRGDLDLGQKVEVARGLAAGFGGAVLFVDVGTDDADRHRQIGIGRDELAQDDGRRDRGLLAIGFDARHVVPAVAVDMAEPDAATRKRGHVGNRHGLHAERLLEEREWIDDPFGAAGARLFVDEIAIRGIAAAAAGDHDTAREHQIAFAMLQHEMRRYVGAERPDDRKRRQHRIERTLEADQRVAVQNAGAVGQIDQAAAEAETDLREQSIGVRERRVPRWQPAVAEDDGANALADLLASPEIEQGRGRAPKPGENAADIRHTFRAGKAGIDVPVGDDQAEMVERHLGETVNPRLIGSRLLAAVIDGENFAPHRFGRRCV
ncbi:MAG: hypothetical protein ACXWJL_10765, partial [Xanthobacteraceae bacterium]